MIRIRLHWVWTEKQKDSAGEGACLAYVLFEYNPWELHMDPQAHQK